MERNELNAHVAAILQDLYAIDPAWKAKEDEIIKLIEKLSASRPDAKIDDNFRQELKTRLLEQLTQKAQQQKQHRLGKLIGIAGSAAAVVIVLAVSAVAMLYSPKATPAGDSGSKVVTVADGNPAPAVSDMLTDKKVLPGPVTRQKITGKNEQQVLVAKEKVSGAITLPSSQIMILDESSTGLAALPDAPVTMAFAADTEPERSSIVTGEALDLDAATVVSSNNTEEYDRIYENAFLDVLENPLSTFSIDVDTASYANVRRFIENNQLPYADAVRIEELVNYFPYDYPNPTGPDPFSFTTEIASCPWNNAHKLLLVGIQGKKIDAGQLPASNLVFLLDVSGSMDEPEKLPLLKAAFKLLVNNLRPADRVAITVYAGAAGLVLDSRPGSGKQEILAAIDNLEAGGSTAGGAGIELAYKTASDHFIKGGNNRVILATDGDFNVGASSDSELIRMIEQKRKQGIFLTVLGFGMGNYKDSKMEQLADKGNGNYAYIDNILEAKKVLVNQLGATLFTIAKDVKIQVEFNPARVKSYRLIGYENRMLAAADFADDTKDAGELGAGHNVTALYELVPAGSANSKAQLKYQETTVTDAALTSAELLTLKFRYKAPEAETSKLLEIPVTDDNRNWTAASENFRFAAAVAEWGLLLRNSEHKAEATFAQVLELANGARGSDPFGYREEFTSLAKKSSVLSESNVR